MGPLLLALVLGASPGTAPLERRLQAASVTVNGGGCAGAIAGDREHVLTAAHCLRSRTGTVDVTYADGETGSATPEVVLEGQDVAVLRLDEPAHVEPLPISEGLPLPGTLVYFRSRMSGPGAPLQTATLVKLAPCPSLPEVDAALHTSIRGLPGDSGAPLVDSQLRVVGLVHGGARCSIAAPASVAAPIVAALGKAGAQCVGAATPSEATNLGVGGSGPE